MKFIAIPNCDIPALGARCKATQSRREEKALRNRVLRGANTPWIPTDRETGAPLTGKEFRLNRERIPPMRIEIYRYAIPFLLFDQIQAIVYWTAPLV